MSQKQKKTKALPCVTRPMTDAERAEHDTIAHDAQKAYYSKLLLNRDEKDGLDNDKIAAALRELSSS